VLARSLLRMGDVAAKEQMETALRDAEQMSELQYLALVRTTFVEAAVLWGRPEIAQAHIQEMMKLSTSTLSPRKWADFAFWASRLTSGPERRALENNQEAFSFDHEQRFEEAVKTSYRQGSRSLAATILSSLATVEALGTANIWYDESAATAGRNTSEMYSSAPHASHPNFPAVTAKSPAGTPVD